MGEMGWGVESRCQPMKVLPRDMRVVERKGKENKTKQMRDCNEGKKMEE